MRPSLRLRGAAAVLAAAGCLLATDEKPASACGGCFHEPPQGPEIDSVVTDHRMVFSLGTSQTVLWDQIRYTGDPKRFAWVLPVHPGAHVELSHDAFIAALDASTQPVITGPTRTCANGTTRSYGGGGGGCGGSATSSAYDDSSQAAPTHDFTGNETVTVVSQSVVGPYETVTVRSTNGEALDAWLVANGFAVPPVIQPTIDAYASEGFDFIALKLEPTAGIRAMQPVRIVSPGADPSLPLRMVAAGIGTHVGLTLYVISEGRYHPQNFADVETPLDKLAWDPKLARSNYQELSLAALQSGNGRGWLTEYSGVPKLERTVGVVPTGVASHPGLADAYYSVCAVQPPERIPCVDDGGVSVPSDAGTLADAGSSDAASSDAASAADGAPDAADSAPPPSGGCYTTRAACDGFDDLDVALRGVSRSSVRVTRLRAFLPADALAEGDLRLAATAAQGAAGDVSSLLHTDRFTDPNFDPCAGAGGTKAGSSSSSGGLGCVCSTPSTTTLGPARTLLVAGVGIFGIAVVRRRRRR